MQHHARYETDRHTFRTNSVSSTSLHSICESERQCVNENNSHHIDEAESFIVAFGHHCSVAVVWAFSQKFALVIKNTHLRTHCQQV